MRKAVFVSLILLIIALPYILLVCSAEANGNANTPTFELTLDPTSREDWSDWCPKHETNTSFVVNLKGTTSSGDPISVNSGYDFIANIPKLMMPMGCIHCLNSGIRYR